MLFDEIDEIDYLQTIVPVVLTAVDHFYWYPFRTLNLTTFFLKEKDFNAVH